QAGCAGIDVVADGATVGRRRSEPLTSRAMIELRALSVLAVGALLSGCAASIAGFGGGHVAGEPRSAIAGGRAYGLVTTSRAGGLALGVVHEEAWTLAKSPSFAPDRFQTALSFGYLDAPLPHRGRVGYEAH